MLMKAVCGLASASLLVMSIMQYVCVFIYRGSASGDVCAGNNIHGKLSASQEAIVMGSKGSFLMFLLVVQWIGVGCMACCCCCMGLMVLCGKTSSGEGYDN